MTLTVPAEWAPHRAMWLGFPSHEDLWQDDLEPAQREVAELAKALAGPGRERVRLMTSGEAAFSAAEALLNEVPGVDIHQGLFGDIWLRDTGPIFLSGGDRASAASFRFNGWGGKYVLEGDDTVARQIADASGAELSVHDFVLEGGAVDHDGAGLVVTTRQCLLNPNRNPGWTQADAEKALAEALGARKVLWLDQGLKGDHTDGHVDNLARFIAPGVIACPMAFGKNDPNAEAYARAAEALVRMSDVEGRPLKVMRIPSPGRITDEDGEVVAASHMNFLIANGAVIAPVYEEQASFFALDALKSLFPNREIIGLSSRAILTGGGSFHCITQQEPTR
jgi:agmatine deiminase